MLFFILLFVPVSSFLNSWHCLGFIKDIDFTKPYSINIGELPLVLWKNKTEIYSTINICRHMGSKLSNAIICHGSLKCQYHGYENTNKDQFGITKIFEDKIFWSYKPKDKNPPKEPFYNNLNYEKSFITIDLPCSLPDGAYNTMDIYHPEFVHPGILGFGSKNAPSNIRNFIYPDKSIGLSFTYPSKSLAIINQNITQNYHMFK